jgi:hypothetical protein
MICSGYELVVSLLPVHLVDTADYDKWVERATRNLKQSLKLLKERIEDVDGRSSS